MLLSQDPCLNIANLTLICQNRCSPSYIKSPICYVGGTWDTVSIVSPSSATLSTIRENFVVYVTENVPLTVTATYEQCTRTITVDVNVVPKITFTQPKCYGESFTVTVGGGFNPSFSSISVNGGPYVNGLVGSGNSELRSDINTVRIKGVNGSTQDCLFNIQVHPVNEVVALYNFNEPYEGSANGSATVKNYQQFSDLKLIVGVSSSNMSASSSGVFSGFSLYEVDSYILYAKPNQCDNYQVYKGRISYRTPTISVISSSLPCNNTHGLITVNVIGITVPSDANITIGNTGIITHPNVLTTVPYGDFTIYYTNPSGGLSAYVSYSFKSVQPEITYSITPVGGDNPPPSCIDPNRVITINYNGDYNSLTITNSSGSVLPWTNQQPHQINYVYPDTITVADRCMNSTVKIATELARPQYTWYASDPACVGLITLTFSNINQFEFIQLTNPVNNTKILVDSSGVVSGLFYYINYAITYAEKVCKVNRTDSFQVNPPAFQIRDEDITYEYGTSSLIQSCGGPGWIMVRPIWKGVASETVTNVSLTSGITSTSFTSQRCYGHYYYPMYRPPLNISFVQFASVSVITPPVCNSSFAYIRIDTTVPIQSVTAGPYSIIKTTNTSLTAYYAYIPSGVFGLDISFYSTTALSCRQGITVVTNPSSPLNNDITYTLTSQDSSNCTNPTGTITVSGDLSNYSLLTVNNKNSSTGVWNIGASYYSTLLYTHNTCGVGGIYFISAPADDKAKFEVSTVTPASCPTTSTTDSNGIIEVRATINNVPYTINSIAAPSQYWSSFIKSLQQIRGVKAGPVEFTIQDNNCKWKVQGAADAKSGVYGEVKVVTYPTDRYHTGLVQYTQQSNIESVTLIESEFGKPNYNQRQFVDLDYNNEYAYLSDTLYAKITYDEYCTQYYPLNTSNPKLYIPQYTILPSTECGSNLFTVQFTQDSVNRFIIMFENYGSVPDNGRITLPYRSYAQSYNYDYINRLGDTLLSYTKISKSLEFDASVLNSNTITPPTITYSNETCGLSNGVITLSLTNTNNYFFSLQDVNGNSAQSHVISSSSIEFTGLSTGFHKLTVTSKTNSACKYFTMIEVFRQSPVLSVSVSDKCSATEGGSLTYTVLPSNLVYTATVDGVASTNTLVTGLTAGNHVVSVSITGSCPATLQQTVYVEQNLFDIHAQQTVDGCGISVITNLDSDGTLELYKGNTLIKSMPTLGSTFTFSSLGTGDYKVVGINYSGCRLQSNSVSITNSKCTSNNSGGDNGLSSSNHLVPSLFLITTIISSIIFIFI